MQIRQMLQCHVDKDNIKDKNQEKKYQKNNYNINDENKNNNMV